MKPQKYAACRSTKENQTISTITNEEQRHTGNNAVQHSGIYEVDQSTQVKTYTDHGNGYGQRSGGTTHYSKVIKTIYKMQYSFVFWFLFMKTGFEFNRFLSSLTSF